MDESFNDLIATLDGGAVLVGENDTAGGADRPYGWVVKIDSQGSIDWQKAWGTPGRDELHAVTLTSDGSLMVGGVTESPWKAWLMKLDMAGNLLWQRAYDGANMVDAIRETPDGGFVLVGEKAGAWVTKVDATGVPIWDKKLFLANPDGVNTGAFDVAVLPDGGVVVVGMGGAVDGNDADSWVVRFGAGGDIIWENAYGGLDYEEASSVVLLSDGNIAVASRSLTFSPNIYGAWIMKLDIQDGSILWQRSFSPFTVSHVPQIIETFDGGLIVSALAAYRGDMWYHAWILRLEPDGTMGEDCQFVLETSVSPVPTASEAEIAPGAWMDGVATELTTTVVPEESFRQPHDTCTACSVLSCTDVVIEPNPACEGRVQTFTGEFSGGESGYRFEWDYEDDGTVDDRQNPASNTLAAGNRTVRFSMTDGCWNPGPQRCTLMETATVLPAVVPPEVSSTSRGFRPLLMSRRTGSPVVDPSPDATAYNVYADAIGSWFFPAATTGTVCSIDQWTQNPDGTIELDYAAPVTSWILVTGSNPCEEGSAGRTSAGIDRFSQGLWELCGPTR